MKHFAITAAALLLATPALADGHGHMADAAAIAAAIPGNTVQGSMSDGTAYTEFYQEDGTIKGADYTGKWSLDGDKMCFDYGEGVDCWGVKIKGDQVSWMNGDVADGTGTLLEGNPNSF